MDFMKIGILYRNYEVAKKFCGLQENEDLNEGSYTNFAQTETKKFMHYMYILCI